jgi:hypothetical protein
MEKLWKRIRIKLKKFEGKNERLDSDTSRKSTVGVLLDGITQNRFFFKLRFNVGFLVYPFLFLTIFSLPFTQSRKEDEFKRMKKESWHRSEKKNCIKISTHSTVAAYFCMYIAKIMLQKT